MKPWSRTLDAVGTDTVRVSGTEGRILLGIGPERVLLTPRQSMEIRQALEQAEVKAQ